MKGDGAGLGEVVFICCVYYLSKLLINQTEHQETIHDTNPK